MIHILLASIPFITGLSSPDGLCSTGNDIYLSAFDSGVQVARTDIQIIVGQGAPVTEPASMLLFGLGLLGLAGVSRKKQ